MCKIHSSGFGGVGGASRSSGSEAVFAGLPAGHGAKPGTYRQAHLLARPGGQVVMSEPLGEQGAPRLTLECLGDGGARTPLCCLQSSGQKGLGGTCSN